MKSKVDVSARNQDPFAFLEAQHREVESLFAEIERVGKGSVRSRRDVFLELAAKLEAHAQLEEAVFYPLGRKVDEKKTLKGFEEHKLFRVVLDDIRKGLATGSGKSADARFEAHVKVLKELVEQHVKEEEESYFSTLRKELGVAEQGTLRVRLQEASAKLEMKIVKKPPTAKAKKTVALPTPRGMPKAVLAAKKVSLARRPTR
ncbi:MAG: hemerythrin domain-containing protein [Silvanigrellales bacterium]|nr:hemerythrin domain-containing protein [Silvanigrellales bacterium]